MSRKILCEASEKGIIVANECLNRGIEINTIKLQQLLILMHGRMLSLYNKPFFSQEVVARPQALMIDKVNKDLMVYAMEFKELIEEYYILLEKEEAVMMEVIDAYGNLNFFDLKELPALKTLQDNFIKKNQESIISNEAIQKTFNFYNNRNFDVMAVSYHRPFIVSSEKSQEFKSKKTNPEIRKQLEEFASRFKINNLIKKGPILTKTKKPNKK